MTDSARQLLIRIDPRSAEPLQIQLYESIRHAILDGVVTPGTRLPSSRALAADLGISRTTTVLALEKLVAEGYVTTRAGAGTFVNRELPDDVARAPAGSKIGAVAHPPLSRRGAMLAALPPIVVKIDHAPRAFRLGIPALDRFPIQLWNRLARRRMQRTAPVHLTYGHAAGLPALREAIADYVSRARGTSCTAEQVVLVAGAQQGLDMMCRLLLDPGDVAWMEEPGYPGARGALIAAGAQIRSVPVDAQGLNVDAGARRPGRVRLVYLTPSHQFPLGVPMSLPRRLALLAWARAARAWVIEDDYDSEFRYGVRPIPCLHGLDVDRRVIYVGSFSKTLFPALRMGFVIVPADLHDSVLKARRAADLHPPIPLQEVVADLMTGGHFERHLRRMQIEYRARLEALSHAIARYCHGALELRDVATGLHAVADLKEGNAQRVFREALARGVEAMPLSAYYADRRRARDTALVLGFGTVPADLVDDGMRQLAAAIEVVNRAEHGKHRARSRKPYTSASAGSPS